MNIEEEFIEGVKRALDEEKKDTIKTVLIKTNNNCIYIGQLVWIHFDGEFYHAELKHCYKFTKDKQIVYDIHKNIFTGVKIKTLDISLYYVLNNFLKEEE